MKVVFWQSLLRVLVEFYIMRDHVCWNNLFWEQVHVAHESLNNLIFLSKGWQLVVLAFHLERSRTNVLRFCLWKERQSVLSSCAFDLVLKFALFDSVTFSLICKELQAGGWICDPLSPAKWFGLLRLHSR
jgi:hypothetical protein